MLRNIRALRWFSNKNKNVNNLNNSFKSAKQKKNEISRSMFIYVHSIMSVYLSSVRIYNLYNMYVRTRSCIASTYISYSNI